MPERAACQDATRTRATSVSWGGSPARHSRAAVSTSARVSVARSTVSAGSRQTSAILTSTVG